MNTLLPNSKHSLSTNQKGATQIIVVALVIIAVAAIAYFLTSSNHTIYQGLTAKPKVQLAASYDLNLVGLPVGVTNPTPAANTLYLPTAGGCTITLTSGQNKVGAGLCSSSSGVNFSLPSNSTGDSATTYAVYYKAIDPMLAGQAGCKKEGADTYCPTYSMLILRGQDNSYTSDVTKLLDNIYVDLKGGASPQRYAVFDDKLKDKVWSMNGTNRLVQLKLYPQSEQSLEAQDSQN